MAELVAELIVSLDGFARGKDSPAYFGYWSGLCSMDRYQHGYSPPDAHWAANVRCPECLARRSAR